MRLGAVVAAVKSRRVSFVLNFMQESKLPPYYACLLPFLLD